MDLGGIIRCQVVRQGPRPLLGESGEIGQLLWSEGSARGEEGGLGIGICGQDNLGSSAHQKGLRLCQGGEKNGMRKKFK